jgi:hypothetical protein
MPLLFITLILSHSYLGNVVNVLLVLETVSVEITNVSGKFLRHEL